MSRAGAIENAKWAMKLAKRSHPLDKCRTTEQVEKMRAGKFSKLRIVEIVYTKTSEQVIETIE